MGTSHVTACILLAAVATACFRIPPLNPRSVSPTLPSATRLPSSTVSPSPSVLESNGQPIGTSEFHLPEPASLGFYEGMAPQIQAISDAFGIPDTILYRNGDLVEPSDAHDVPNEIWITLLLVYTDAETSFEITAPGIFTPTNLNQGTVPLCLTTEGDYWPREIEQLPQARVPQQELLYRDLTKATGLPAEQLFEALRRPKSCIPIEVSLPSHTLPQTPVPSVADFTRQSEECQLPCWNGLTPGKSKATHIPAFFDRLGVPNKEVRVNGARDKYWAFIANYPFLFPDLPAAAEVKTTDGIVEAIAVYGYDFYDFLTIRHLVDSLGPPQEIWLNESGGQGWLPYQLVLNYPALNTAVSIRGETLLDDPKICNAPGTKYAISSASAIMYTDASDFYFVDNFGFDHGIPDLLAALNQPANAILGQLFSPGSCLLLPVEAFVEP